MPKQNPRYRRRDATERVDIPESMANMIENRCAGIFRACTYEPNVLRSLMLSCYAQGLQDGVQVAVAHPETVELLSGGHGEAES